MQKQKGLMCLFGICRDYKVKDVKLGLSHTFGGPPQVSAVAILGRDLDKTKAKSQ